MSFRNQKVVLIKEYGRAPRDKEHLYAMYNIDAFKNAVNSLSRQGILLWLIINQNQDGFVLELSQKACEEYSLKKDSYYKAVDELIKNNYLVQESFGSNRYVFYENGDGKAPKFFCESNYNDSNVIALSEKQNAGFDNSDSRSKKSNKPSEIQQRNITNNTNNNTSSISLGYINNNVLYSLEKTEKNNKYEETDYSYLESIIFGDSGFTNEKYGSTWVDELNPKFWDEDQEAMIKDLIKYVGLNYNEAKYALENILETEEENNNDGQKSNWKDLGF